MRPPRPLALARSTAAVGGALALVVLAAMALSLRPGEGSRPDGVAPVPAAPSAVVTASDGPQETAVRRPGPPVALRVPALDVDARVVAVGLDTAGVLVPPADPRVVGWWGGGARPGSARGAAVLTGHTVHDGGGVFDDLAALEVGDVVEVVTRTRVLTFGVRRVRDLGKDRLAADAGRLFGRTGSARLVLVTCTDWDGTGYLGNTVVVARVR